MAIVKYANQSGTVYVYESISEWDPVKKQSRSKRKCLGKVDPDTGEIIPTSGKRGRPARKREGDLSNSPHEQSRPALELEKLRDDYEKLKSQNEELFRENQRLNAVISRIKNDIEGI